MVKENVTVVIDAEDKASAKIRQTQQEIKGAVREVKDLGDRSSASADLVEGLANQLGGGAFGDFAGEIASMSGRVNAFSEIMETGKGGVLAFQAGLVATAGILSFKVGKALGDVIFQTQQLNEEMRVSAELAKRLDEETKDLFLGSVKTASQASNELRGLTATLSSLKAKRDELMAQARDPLTGLTDRDLGLVTNQTIEIDNVLSEIENVQSRVSLLTKLRTSFLKSEREQSSKQQAEQQRKANESVAKRQMEARKALEKQRADAAKREIERQKRVAKATQEAQKKEAKARIASIRDAMALDRKRLSQLRKQAGDIGKLATSTLAPQLQAGGSNRAITGQARSAFRKTAETIELERITKHQRAIEANTKAQERLLERIEQQGKQIKTITV